MQQNRDLEAVAIVCCLSAIHRNCANQLETGRNRHGASERGAFRIELATQRILSTVVTKEGDLPENTSGAL